MVMEPNEIAKAVALLAKRTTGLCHSTLHSGTSMLLQLLLQPYVSPAGLRVDELIAPRIAEPLPQIATATQTTEEGHASGKFNGPTWCR